jgi:hypothetical protein
MNTNNILESLIIKLDETGISDLPGGFLYSGIDTLTPAKAYMLGYNPGGDDKMETNSPKAHLQELMRRAPDWNEYLDGVWYPGGRRCPVGRAPLQTRVQALLTGIGLSTRSVCASNLIFVRSRDQAGLSQASQFAEKCWAVHRLLLEQVQPQAILSIGGGKVFDFIVSHGRLLSPVEQRASGHGDWQCQATRVAIGNRAYNLISLPHLSRYAVNRHPDVIKWVKTKALL